MTDDLPEPGVLLPPPSQPGLPSPPADGAPGSDDPQTHLAGLVLPRLAPEVRLEVRRADLTLLGRSRELTTFARVHQRQETWAELELPKRQRIWYFSLESAIVGPDASLADLDVLLFAKLGNAFQEQALLRLTQAHAVEPPAGGDAALLYTFPEIEARQLLLRLEVAGSGGGPAQPAPFTLSSGEAFVIGPSYPADVTVAFDGGPTAWTHPGELKGVVESRDVSAALQAAADARDLRAAAAGPRTVAIQLASSAAGLVRVPRARATLELVREGFGAARRELDLVLEGPDLRAEAPLPLPELGEPILARLRLQGTIPGHVIRHELGAARATRERTGVRIAGHDVFQQAFEVDDPFALTQVELLLAQPADDSALEVRVAGPDGAVLGHVALPTGSEAPPAPDGAWRLVALASPFPLEPRTRYELRVRMTSGAVSWLCGLADGELGLARVAQPGAPARPVTDGVAGSPLRGQTRLRAARSSQEPGLRVSLQPGGAPLALRDLDLSDGGGFRAHLDLLEPLRAALAGGAARNALSLRLEARSEGDLLLTDLELRCEHRLLAGEAEL